jgi:hypothetical protein
LKIKRSVKNTLIIPALALALTAGAHAGVIIDYNSAIAALTSSPIPASVTATIDSNLVGASILSRAAYTAGNPSTGLNPRGAAGRFSSLNVLTDATINTLAGAINFNKYYSFNVTPGSEITLDLSAITFSLQSSSTSASNYALLSSAGGFTISSSIQQGSITIDSIPTSITVSDATLGTAFDSLTGPVEFRIYLWGGTGTQGTTSVNALQVSGVAAVPEPTTLALTGLASTFMLWNLRRRQRVIV